MKKEKQKTLKTVEKQPTEREKNKAEIFIVCLCWVCLFIAIMPIFIPAVRDNLRYFARPSDIAQCHGPIKYYVSSNIVEFFNTHQHMLLYIFLLFAGLILFFHILLAISKRKDCPHIRPKYYRTLLGFLWIILLEISFIINYVVNYPC